MPSYPYALSLTNPGAETGDATGWTDVTGGPLQSVTTQGGSTPYAGTRFFFAGAGATTEAYQLVTLPLDALMDVDAGLLSARLTGRHSGLTDEGRLAVTFHNSGGTQIGPSVAQQWRASGVNEWLLRTLEAPVPVGTRSLRFRLLGNRISGTNLDSYWDELALALFVPVARIAIVSANTAHESALDNYNAITALGYSVTPFSDANSPNVDFTLYDLVGLIESSLSVADCLNIRAAGVPMFTDRGDQLRVWSAASFASDQNTGNTDVIASHPVSGGFLGPTSIQSGQTFRYYPLASATVIGTVICTMDFVGTADARIENAVEFGTPDTSGNLTPARIVANGWLRTTGVSLNANGITMLSAMVAWLLSGLADAPVILSVTNVTTTTAKATASAYNSPDSLAHQASQFRVRRSGALNVAHTSAVLGPVTTYTTPDNTLIPGRAYEFSAQYQDANDVWSGWGPWSTAFTTVDDDLIPMCGGTPAWMSVAQYMESAWNPGSWLCVGLGCNEGNALYGRPLGSGLPALARVQKYEIHSGHNPLDPTTWIARARRASSHVRALVGLGAAEVLLHPWGGQIDGFCGVCHSVTDDQGGDYGVAAGFRVGEINEGLGGCVDFGTPHDASIELYIFGPGGAVPVISTPIAQYAQLKGRLLNCGGAVCFRAIAPVEIDSVWLHEGGNNYYYRVEILGDVLEGTVTLSQPLPDGYDGVALETPGGGEMLFLEFASPVLTVSRPCELILQVFEADRFTVAWETGTNPAHSFPYLCLPENYGEQEIDIVAGAATIGQVEAIVIDKPEIPGDQDTGWLTARINDVFGRRCRMLRFIDEDLGWVVIADGPAATPRFDESYAAYRWLIRDTREKERKVRAFLEASETTSVWPSGVFYTDFGPATAIDPIVGNYSGFGYAVGVDWDAEWVGTPGDTSPLPTVPDYLAIKPAAEKMLNSEIEQVSFFGSIAGPLWRHSWPNLKFAWRPVGSTNPFTVIDAEVIVPYSTSFVLASVFNAQLADGTEVRAIYKLYTPWWALDATPPEPNEPPDGDIEIHLVYRGALSVNTPYHLEGLTSGEFLLNAYEGVYSPVDPVTGDIVPTGIRYDAAALALMTDEVRLRLTEPIDDLRDWTEKYIYAPSGWVAALDNDGQISPVSQIPPARSAVLTEIHNDITEPAPNWNAGERVVNYLVFKYPRLYVPATNALEVEALDGILIQDVIIEFRDESSIDQHGEEKAEYDGRAFAAVGDPSGSSTGTPPGAQPLNPPTPDGSTLSANNVILEWLNAYPDAYIQIWIADGSQWPSDTPGSGYATEQPPLTTSWNTGKAPYELLTPTYAAIRHRRGTDYSYWVFYQGSPGYD